MKLPCPRPLFRPMGLLSATREGADGLAGIQHQEFGVLAYSAEKV